MRRDDEDKPRFRRLLIMGGSRAAVVAPATYSGPGDIATFLTWGGLRAYSAATIGSNCVRLIRASDSAQQNFVTLANGSLDIASIATFLAATTGKVVTLYDQTGNGLDLTQASAALRPVYTASAIGALPGMTFNAVAQTKLAAAGTFTDAQPFGGSFVAKRTGNTSAFNTVLSTTNVQYGFNTAADTVFIYTGANVATAAAADSSPHAVQGIFNNASSAIYVDGTGTTGLNLGSATGLSGSPFMGESAGTGNNLEGVVFEGGWLASLDATVADSLTTNQRAYWGF